jgi:hypothetical protein
METLSILIMIALGLLTLGLVKVCDGLKRSEP